MRREANLRLMLSAAFIISILFITADVFAAPPDASGLEKESKEKISISQDGISYLYYLVVEDIHRDADCRIILKLANKGVATIPFDIYKHIKIILTQDYIGGGYAIGKFLSDINIDISSPGATYTWHTPTTLQMAAQVTAKFNDVDSVKTEGSTKAIGAGPCALIQQAPEFKIGPIAKKIPEDIVPEAKEQIQGGISPVEINGPDLQVTDFAVDILPAGQKDLDGNTYPTKRYYFVWTVRNMGNEIASASKLKVTYEVLSGSPTGTDNLAYVAGVPQLWPNPNQLSGARNVWNQPSFAAPDSPVTFRFRAEIDPDDNVGEKQEGNNVLIKEITISKFMLTPPLGVLKKKSGFQQGNQERKPLKPKVVQYPVQGQVFFAPAHITPQVQGGGKANYLLKKKVKGSWIVQKTVTSRRLTIAEPGFYCLTLAPEVQTAGSGKCIPFEVKANKTRKKLKATQKNDPPAGAPAGAGKPNVGSKRLRRRAD